MLSDQSKVKELAFWRWLQESTVATRRGSRKACQTPLGSCGSQMCSETSEDHYEESTQWIIRQGHKRRYRESFHCLEIETLKPAYLRIAGVSLTSFYFWPIPLWSVQIHPCEPLGTEPASCTCQHPRGPGPQAALPCLSWSNKDTCWGKPAILLSSPSHQQRGQDCTR